MLVPYSTVLESIRYNYFTVLVDLQPICSMFKHCTYRIHPVVFVRWIMDSVLLTVIMYHYSKHKLYTVIVVLGCKCSRGQRLYGQRLYSLICDADPCECGRGWGCYLTSPVIQSAFLISVLGEHACLTNHLYAFPRHLVHLCTHRCLPSYDFAHFWTLSVYFWTPWTTWS